MLSKTFLTTMAVALLAEADTLERDLRTADDHEIDEINVVGIVQNRKTAELLEKWMESTIEEKEQNLKKYWPDLLPMFASMLRSDIKNIKDDYGTAAAA